MKKWIMSAVLIATTVIGVCMYLYFSNRQNAQNSYEAERTSVSDNSPENNTQNTTENNNPNSTAQSAEAIKSDSNIQSSEAPKANNSPVEAEELASFSTKIYTKDSSRQNNVGITCSTLNNTDVANGQTFSFCNTVGRASPSKGYKKADIFTNGEKTKGYGGGNCQVSTTLYNAVLAVPDLKVTERHEHSNKVPYIQSGKDAAVSYGTYDFKFVNNTGSNIRIKAENTPDNVTVKIVKLI